MQRQRFPSFYSGDGTRPDSRETRTPRVRGKKLQRFSEGLLFQVGRSTFKAPAPNGRLYPQAARPDGGGRVFGAHRGCSASHSSSSRSCSCSPSTAGAGRGDTIKERRSAVPWASPAARRRSQETSAVISSRLRSAARRRAALAPRKSRPGQRRWLEFGGVQH